MTLPGILFVVATFSTVFCTAVNCYTFRIAYPLWRRVGAADFASLHREYLRLLTPIITLPHVVMFFSAAAMLAPSCRPAQFSNARAMLVFSLAGAVVVLSAFVAGPIHTRFERAAKLDEAGLHRLLGISAFAFGDDAECGRPALLRSCIHNALTPLLKKRYTKEVVDCPTANEMTSRYNFREARAGKRVLRVR